MKGFTETLYVRTAIDALFAATRAVCTIGLAGAAPPPLRAFPLAQAELFGWDEDSLSMSVDTTSSSSSSFSSNPLLAPFDIPVTIDRPLLLRAAGRVRFYMASLISYSS